MGNKPLIVNVLVDRNRTQVIGCQLQRFTSIEEQDDFELEDEGMLKNPYKTNYLG